MKYVKNIALSVLCGICLIGCDPAEGKPYASPGIVPADSVLHVSTDGDDKTADGSDIHPFTTIPDALAAVKPGMTISIHAGTYQPFEVNAQCSGTEKAPVTIRAAEGEKPVIQSTNDIGIHLINVDNLVISGLEVVGGTHGIYYESTPDQGEKTLENIMIQNCVVHDINGTHGICVYAANYKAPVKNITMENCEVFDCRCDSSESTVFNGNIDGFTIRNNQIHNNNNIGIDMIGFEGTARHRDDYKGNPYDVDFARNGKCYGNVVYAISTFGNNAYREGTGYSLCAGGIYVDGGQNIEIYNNFIFSCDIGIEVATEHSPKDNPLFHVSGVEVHDNIIANCQGYCGLAFGGYDADLGRTEDCIFRNNTFVDNPVQIVVQRSARNQIHHNLFVGGEVGIEYNTDCAETDLVNDFGENFFCMDGEANDLLSIKRYGDTLIFPQEMQKLQRTIENRENALSGLRSDMDGFGSAFVPNEAMISLYESYLKNTGK
jgi:hypothetical protein